MKLVVAVVQDIDASKLNDLLVSGGYSATKLASTGGFLRKGNTTYLIGVENEKVDQLITLIKENCSTREEITTPFMPVGGPTADSYIPYPIEVPIGGAIIFVLDIERMERV
jgi:uncharacterized protein YaaQ